MSSVKVYIAGKITNNPEFKSQFTSAKEYFEDLGFIVLNPADLPEGLSRADYMRICFAMIDSSDLVFFLNTYENSPGAMLELNYAEYIGKKIQYQYDIDIYTTYKRY